MSDALHARLNACLRASRAKLIASLSKHFGSLQTAEDALSAALEAALKLSSAQADSIHDFAAWLYASARNAGIDQQRKLARVEFKSEQLNELPADSPDEDDRLHLMLMCAHPALSTDTQAMLMLRYCANVEIEMIARWFFQAPDAVQRRLHRAKAKLAQSGVRCELPAPEHWQMRVQSVLSCLEILYDQSYSNVAGGAEVDACAREAEQLSLQLVDALSRLPQPRRDDSMYAEAIGLCAMLVLGESRRATRLDANREMVPLHLQPCAHWDQMRIDLAAHMLLRAAKLQQAGPYQLRALIFAHHARRKALGHTPWIDIFDCFARLLSLDEHPQIRFGWTLAALHVQGAAFARHALDAIDCSEFADAHRLSYCLVDAEIAAGEGDVSRQRAALAKAVALQSNIAEQKYLQRRLAGI
jgi:RNA polymerase sigma-70 factor, ECF subfamily